MSINYAKLVERMMRQGRDNIPMRVVRIINLLKGRGCKHEQQF